jgi:type II secretory pathway component PulF
MNKKSKNHASALDVSIDFGRVSLLQKMLFAKQLALMLKSGMSITDALKLIYSSSQGTFKQIIADIYNSVKAGRGLAAVMARYPRVFSSFFQGAVLAGEASGNLELNLQNVAAQLKKDKELVDKIKSALFYPVIVIVAAIIIASFVALYVLPKITPLLLGFKVQLPWTTRFLIWLSAFMQAWGLYLLAAFVVMVILTVLVIRQNWASPFFHRLYLTTPVVGNLTRNLNLSRISFNLGILLRSGLTITESLTLVAGSLNNYYYRQALVKVAGGVTKGGSLAASLARYPDYFPEMMLKMLKVGEESGHLEDSLLYIAEFYETEIDTATKNLATALEPALLIFIGLVVGFLAIAIITPIYSITGSITR